jgi:predicted enzyme related to lactoylglutathione lyase
MSTENNCPKTGEFSWNELVSTDVASAKKFYTGLFGWQAESFPAGADYTLFKQGDTMVGGLMKCPKPGLPSHWLPYVTVDDVDASAAKAKGLGAQVVMEPFDVPTVGRIAVLLDPQGAAIGLFKPMM